MYPAKHGKGLGCKKVQKSNINRSVSGRGRPSKALALIIIPVTISKK
jgi:hypothetical protein